ncbi:MAG: hypothetical protein DME93_02710 [Verrucomicrobia bacterium]|nr:MAG: hypothetical protein DME93_02710 [Verrucomicrobiota bacterium]
MKSFSKTFVISAGLSVTMLACADPVAAQKPHPAGIIDLPGAIDADDPIGPISDHPWLNVNVDGLRVRTGWDDLEIADNVYNWPLIDDCLANALTSGKFIGLGVISGLDAPPWLMGGVTFTDAWTTTDVATLTSSTANFVTGDVGKVIVCDAFPVGTTIVSIISSTVVQTSTTATRTTTNTPVAFSILARNTGGAAFRVLTAPDQGVMPVPWDPLAKAKWKEFVTALGARYDSNPQLGYMVMTGFCQTGEAYLATAQADIDFFNASAIAAGYVPTPDLPAGLVAWEATVEEIVDTYMTAFPTTPLLITGARPYPDLQGGTRAMNDIFAWGVATYPGRFGIMNSQLHATSTVGYFLNAAIYANYLTEPVGIQFLCSTSTDDNVARLSNSPPYGSDPLLSAYDAINNSFTAAVNIGCKFAETYEVDVENPAYQTMLATQGAALRLNASATPTADLSVALTDGKTTVDAGAADTYTVVVSNAGPSGVSGAVVSDTFPAIFTGVTYTATQTGGASGFTAAGSGNISDTVTMPIGSSITYKASGTISSSATGTLSDTATVTAPSDVADPNLANNSATDIDTITLRADLKVTVTDKKSNTVSGAADTYTIVVTNAGPSRISGAVVSDNFPAIFTGVTYTATQIGGASGFTASGSGNISDTVTMPAGSVITYIATGTISPSAPTGTLSDTATVTAPSGVTDPNLNNNSATDTDTLMLAADLKVTVTDGKKKVVAGATDTYTIVVTNVGLANVTGGVATDNFPAIFTGVTYTATQTGGASGFTATGSGNISDTVTMPAGSVITYIATGTISSSATGTLSDTGMVTAPSGVTDPNLANNSATDTDTLTRH